MGLLARMEARTLPASDDRWYGAAPQSTDSGEDVSPDNALSMTAMWRGVDLIAGTLGTLPLGIFKRAKGGGWDPADDQDHPLSQILLDGPNDWQAPGEFIEMGSGHATLRGNFIAQKIVSRSGQLKGLVPLHPDRIQVLIQGGQLIYRFQSPAGGSRDFKPEEIFHLRGLGSNGITGLSAVGLMRNAIGLGIAAEKHAARTFKNAARPSGVLKHPNELSNEARANIKKSWYEMQAGDSANSIAIFEEGMEWQDVGMTSTDAQLIENRKFQVVEVARILGIPPHLLFERDNSPRANVEQEFMEFGSVCVRPWAERWERRIKKDLMTPVERRTFEIRFDLGALLRADMDTRYKGYAVARQWGWFSADDVLAEEGRNPLSDGQGKIYLVPFNMANAKDYVGGAGGATPMDQQAGAGDAGAAAARLLAHGNARLLGAGGVERRFAQIVDARRRQRRANERIIASTADQMVRREVGEVRKHLKKATTARDLADFRGWIDTFYEDHAEKVARAFDPVMLTVAEHVQSLAAQEAGAEPGLTPDMETFAHTYTQSLGRRWAATSLGQLRKILRDASPEDAPAAITTRLDQWEHGRAKKVGHRQAVQSDGAFARETYRAAGVQEVRWHAMGSECPLCSTLDGSVVGIGDPFVARGGVVAPGGDTAPLIARRPVRHPPLHGDGCDCMITAA